MTAKEGNKKNELIMFMKRNKELLIALSCLVALTASMVLLEVFTGIYSNIFSSGLTAALSIALTFGVIGFGLIFNANTTIGMDNKVLSHVTAISLILCIALAGILSVYYIYDSISSEINANKSVDSHSATYPEPEINETKIESEDPKSQLPDHEVKNDSLDLTKETPTLETEPLNNTETLNITAENENLNNAKTEQEDTTIETEKQEIKSDKSVTKLDEAATASTTMMDATYEVVHQLNTEKIIK